MSATPIPQILYHGATTLGGSIGATTHGGTFINATGNVTYHSGPNQPTLPDPGPPVEGITAPPTALYFRATDEKDSELYARLLWPKGLGYPIWCPSPNSNLPEEYLETGVRIGDVGIITSDGSFEFLFNIFLPMEHPINVNGVPEGFTPVEPLRSHDITSSRDAPIGSCLKSANIDGNTSGQLIPPHQIPSRYSFRCESHEGAILVLPEGSEKSDVANRIGRLRQYAAQNAESWYYFANGDLEREAVNGSIHLVTGCVKCTSWALAAFSKSRLSSGFVDLQLSAASEQVDNTHNYRWSQSGPGRMKYGPTPVSKANQCLFIRTFCIELSKTKWTSLFGGNWNVTVTRNLDLEPSKIFHRTKEVPCQTRYPQFSRSRNSGNKEMDRIYCAEVEMDVTTTATFSNPSDINHPSRIITRYLLDRVPDASVAIAHHDDWRHLLHDEEENFPEPELLMQRLESRFTIQVYTDQGGVFLQPNFSGGRKSIITGRSEIINDSTVTTNRAIQYIGTNDPEPSETVDRAHCMLLDELGKQMLARNEHEATYSETLTGINRLVITYTREGKHSKAMDIQAQVLDVCTRILGNEHPDTLSSMNNLAVLYTTQGQWMTAETILVQTSEVRARILGKEHPNTLTSMNNLALVYYKQGKWVEAETIQTQVLEMRTRILGKEHRDTLSCMINLSATYNAQRKWTEAETILIQALEIRSRTLGSEHPDTVSCMNDLAVAYYEQGKYDEAENIQTQVLEIRARVWGMEHPEALSSMNNLALTYYKQGKHDEAATMQTQVLEIRTKVLGREHPDTLTSMNDMALSYIRQNKRTHAERILTQVVEMRTRVLGKEHPDTISSMSNLAGTYYELRKWTEAENILNDIVEMQSRIFGEEHPNTVLSKKNLTQVYDRMRMRKEEAPEIDSEVHRDNYRPKPRNRNFMTDMY